MFNPDKDFNRKLMEALGKDGKSISALAKDLEGMGIKHHRLILTGYLRALTDLNYLKEREVPPSKIYLPIKALPDSVYESVGKACRRSTPDADELILYVLSRIFKRAVFESELRLAGVTRNIGVAASERDVADCRKILKRAGNVIPSQTAVYPSKEFPDQYCDILTDIIIENKDSRHLVMETKQTKLI